MHRAGFELLRKNTSSEGKIDDVGDSRNKYGGTLEKKCSRNGIKFTVSNRTPESVIYRLHQQ
jgi:hypothetical protein